VSTPRTPSEDWNLAQLRWWPPPRGANIKEPVGFGPRPAGVLPPGTSVPRPAEGVEVPRPTRTRSDSDWWEPAGHCPSSPLAVTPELLGLAESVPSPAGVASCQQPLGPCQCLGAELPTVSPRVCSSKADLSPLRVPHPCGTSKDPEWPRVARGVAGHSERPPQPGWPTASCSCADHPGKSRPSHDRTTRMTREEDGLTRVPASFFHLFQLFFSIFF
jgi:hypothetical protein